MIGAAPPPDRRHQRPRPRLGRALVLAGGLWAWALAGPAQAARFGLLVGNDQGQNGEEPLRFAESDAARLGDILTRLGGFTGGATVVLRGRSADEVRRSLVELAERLRATPGEHLALIYYSGHADAQSLHLGASSLPLSELRDSLKSLPAAMRLLIVDACQAGVLTRAKGARAGSEFQVALASGEQTQGLAVLASSAASELAQESDALGASVFTHFLSGGLAGLADRNRDGIVALSEAFQFTAERTLAATLGTAAGPQHPTFHLDLAGRDDLVLTRPGARGPGYGHLRLDVPGWYFVRRPDGTIAAELVSRGDETLALAPGSYEVSRRGKRSLEVAALRVDEGGAAAISQAPSRAVPFGAMVRKGQGPSAAYGVVVGTSVRTPLEGLGTSVGATLAGRLDLSALSLELRLGIGRAAQASAHLSSRTWDASASAALLRAFDGDWARRLAGLTWALGIEGGATYLRQTLDQGNPRGSVSPFAGPVALADLSVGRRFFVRAELRAPIYALRVAGVGGDRTVARPALAAGLGAGMSF